ncbi:PAB-dependent poly(A)-specific ribonuclease subunit PAN3 [Xylariaceae sp. FL0255]|nr:PAB-dependent poly(A)-specific ribonuclease subunit PAN3 [Xylariaceae sp. FL0255]
MATARFGNASNGRQMASPRPKTRDSKDTLCRNVLIYGHCRYEDQGCAFNHDQNKNSGNSHDNQTKKLNVDSPSFTPAQPGAKKTNFSTSATPFTPRGASGTASASNSQPTSFNEFNTSHYDNLASTVQSAANGSADNSMAYDPFLVPPQIPHAPYNPYAEEHNPLVPGAGTSYYGAQNQFSPSAQAMLLHHLYLPTPSARDSLQGHQRSIYDFFLPENLREESQKKSDAARQVLPQQPGVTAITLLQYHSLVPLKPIKQNKNLQHTQSIFEYPTWVWKATSSTDGNVYCLRRIQGFRLTDEDAMKAVKSWKKIRHPNIVSTIEAFTTRVFNDGGSTIFVHTYHPLSKSLAEHHFPSTPAARYAQQHVPEEVLWSYLAQLASALRTIHKAKLAARCIDLSKIILTNKNHIRLSACSILDVIHFEKQDLRSIEQLQHEDLINVGRVILSLAMNTPTRNLQERLAVEQLGQRAYSSELKERLIWLLTPSQSSMKTSDQLVRDLACHTDDLYQSTSFAEEELERHLGRELENGRLCRLFAKLGCINERPEYAGDPNWSETGERYSLKLFRDFVFHKVDANGNPVLDLGQIITTMNKLDAGTDELIYITTRDSETAFIMSYKELKKQVEITFADLQKPANRGGR